METDPFSDILVKITEKLVKVVGFFKLVNVLLSVLVKPVGGFMYLRHIIAIKINIH